MLPMSSNRKGAHMASHKSTGSKPTSKGAKPAAVRPKSAATPPVSAPPPTTAAPEVTATGEAGPLKKQELIAKVVARTEVSKKHAKPVVEALLEILGATLSEGREVNLQPMGRIKQKRVKDTGTARVIVANIRQTHASAIAQPLVAGAPAGSGDTAKEAVADEVE